MKFALTYRGLYEHEPSPYVAESFKLDRENIISILSAFYLVNQFITAQVPPEAFDVILTLAIYHLEKMYERYERSEERRLGLLIFADNPGAVPGALYKYNCGPHLYRFDEVGTVLSEGEMHQFKVWAILALTGEAWRQPSRRSLSRLDDFLRRDTPFISTTLKGSCPSLYEDP